MTGPQRSGTRIGAKILAYETGHRYIDEDRFEVDNEVLFCQAMASENIVIQCPGMCHIIHRYSDDETLIVLMVRPVQDIIASEKRVGWQTGPYPEYEKYGVRREVAKFYRGRGLKPISQVKYDFWHKYQKQAVKHYWQLYYDSLAGHPLWVPKNERLNFEATQTTTNMIERTRINATDQKTG